MAEQKFTIDLSGTKGLANRFYGDKNLITSQPNLRYFGSDGQLAEGIFNPISYLGYMSPANNTTKACTGTTNFLLTSALIVPYMLIISDTDSIFFSDEAVTGTTGKILNLDTAIDTSLDQSYEIPIFDTNKYSKCEDMILYQLDGEQTIYFTRSNTTSGGASNNAIGVAVVDFSNPDPDWSTDKPVGYSTSFLNGEGRTIFVVSDNGFMYVLRSNKIHKIDGGSTGGTNGTLTKDVLVFSGGVILNDAIDLRGKMYIAMSLNNGYAGGDITRRTQMNTTLFSNQIGVYVWNRSSVVVSMQDFIPINGIKELKSLHIFQGQPSCFTTSVDGYTQFRVWNGTEFKIVKTLGKNAYPNYRRHSVHENGDNIMWFGNDGKIYCYGKIEEGLENALYIIGDMTSQVTTGQTFSSAGVFIAANEVESVTSGNQTFPLAFYLSYKDTGGNHLRKWYPYSTDTVATIEQKGHQGNVYTLVKYIPDMSTIKYIDIRCAPTGTGTDIIATIKYYFNGSSTASITKTITKTEASRGYVRHDLNKPYINAIQMEIEFSTTNTLGSGNDFRPSIALISYEDTNTKG
jgi:hypothetical protein